MQRLLKSSSFRTRTFTAMSNPSLWLRCETKEFEKRAALSPTASKRLLDAGFNIFVERDKQRIFDDSEYEA
jgi:saccharopine dehydrogenase (NAD+, L-lysine-forming)